MTANDVGFVTQPSDATRRLTIQHFDLNDFTTEMIVPHNSDARISDSTEWPPPVMFDIAYGCAAIKTWEAASFIDFARGRTRDFYYTDGDSSDDENGDGGNDVGKGRGRGSKGTGGDKKPRAELSQQNREHDTRAARQEERRRSQQASGVTDPQAPDLADIVMALWMQNACKGQCQAHAMKVDRTREKVQTWLDSTAE